MTMFNDIQTFVREANRTTRSEDLKTLLSDIVRTMGFDYVALVHHVNLAGPLAEAVEMVEYPTAWKERVRSRGYFSEDPVLAACQNSAAAFRWSEVGKIIPLTSRQTEILSSAGAYGLGEGFTVPVSVPGEFLGSCSFGMAAGRELPEDVLPGAQYVGCFAFEAARRVRRRAGTLPAAGERPKLSQRQFDCLVLAAQGKSDWDIGQLLGISHQTVHQHVEEAKRRYGVASRTQLVVRALFDNQITFADIVH